jgi:hypothetical protein
MNERVQLREILIGVCEALGCKAQATLKVPVKVGEKGRIFLFLCEKCRARFVDSESNQTFDSL